MTDRNLTKKDVLSNKGVTIINPESVEIGAEVDSDRVSSKGVTFHTGTKIYGEKTLILNGARLGYESPVTIENCFIGPDVNLRGGYYKDSVFLKNVSFGSCAHVREGCILEEESGAAHSVGLKQTILFPYVMLGSLINLCDCFMSGGTGKKNHSEVGSSYIHFNFTPQQDKATPSLIGDVPNGVMLDQAPIFLGGQGGLVGPCRLNFGVTVAAGTICRKDELRPNRLIFGGEGKGGNISYTPGMYSNVKRVLTNNMIYIGNLYALEQWYEAVRYRFISEDFTAELHEGLLHALNLAISERIKRLKEFVAKLDELSNLKTKNMDNSIELVKRWPDIEASIKSLRRKTCHYASRDQFSACVDKEIQNSGKDYIQVIRQMSPDAKKTGTLWLQEIVDNLVSEAMALLPSYSSHKSP